MTINAGAAEAAKMKKPVGARPEREQGKTMSDEELAKLTLESLLYYVLAGGGRRNL